MSAKEVIRDYDEHFPEIEKWLALKGEIKYLRFATLLNTNKITVEWCVLRDVYRYDKRLLINLFKYLSFFEEFLRAQIWNISQTNYKKLEKACLAKVIDEVIKYKSLIKTVDFSVDTLTKNRDLINYLRNRVSHNKIILESKKNGFTIKTLLTLFKETLPESYRHGFIADVNKCTDKLKLPICLAIKL